MSEKSPICPSCGETVNPEGKFCARCGMSLHGEVEPGGMPAAVCSRCDAAVGDGDLFCPSCGAPQHASDEETTRDGHAEPEVVRGVVAETDEPAPDTVGGESAGEAAGCFGLLRVVSQEEFGREFPLGSEVVRIGKESGADIVFHGDNYMSHAHARVLIRDGMPEIEDLGSRNGTFVQVRDRCRLQHGDRVLIGATVLEYREPTPADE